MARKQTTSPPRPKAVAEDRRHRSLAELASEQGITAPQDFEALCGAGADLWEDGAEFEVFLAGLRESRRTGG
jgi:hypothetical protein